MQFAKAADGEASGEAKRSREPNRQPASKVVLREAQNNFALRELLFR